MILYIITLMYWGIIWFLTNNIRLTKQGRKLLFIFISSASLILIMGLRDISVGTDIERYFLRFENSLLDWHNTNFGDERGYILLNLFFKNIGISFQWFLAFASTFFVSSISMMYYAYSKNVFLSFYLNFTMGLFPMAMTGLRQTFAICITIIGVFLLLKNKRLLFVMLTLIAFSFHTSSIVVFIFLLIYKFKLNRKQALIIYFLSIGVPLLILRSSVIFDFILSLIQKTKYTDYIGLIEHYQRSLKLALASSVIPLFSIFYFPKHTETTNMNDTFSLFFLASCFTLSINILDLTIPLIGRIGYYFLFYNTLLIPNTLESINDRKTKNIFYIAFIVAGFIQMILTFGDALPGIVPYKLMSSI